MSKIKPIIKTNNNKFSLSSWILEKFPENYEQMKYIEPFVGNGSILLNKNKSIEEVANDIDFKIINIWRSIRDEQKLLRSKLGKIRYCEKTFNEIKNKKEDKDYLKQSFIELSLRKMSKFGQKEIYDGLDRKKLNILWKNIMEDLPTVAERIKDVYFLNKNPIEVINSFNDSNTLCYYCPPPLPMEKSDSDIMSINDHIEFGESLNSYRGKAIVCAANTPVYRRMFNSWKVIKKKNSAGTVKDFIWINF